VERAVKRSGSDFQNYNQYQPSVLRLVEHRHKHTRSLVVLKCIQNRITEQSNLDGTPRGHVVKLQAQSGSS